MRNFATLAMLLMLSITLWGCGDDEKAKGEEKKAEEKTEERAQVAETREDDLKFNHAASIKMVNSLKELPEIKNPIIVVHEKEAIIAYQTDQDKEKAEATARKKLKKDMPTYDLHFVSNPAEYERVRILYEDTIESEGRPIEDLSKHFNHMKK